MRFRHEEGWFLTTAVCILAIGGGFGNNSGGVHAQEEPNSITACPYLVTAPAVEYELPRSAFLQNNGGHLPLQFVGVATQVKRETLPFGAAPKITITRYSTEPMIEYDEMTGMVTISTESCAEAAGLGAGASMLYTESASRMASRLLVASTSLLLLSSSFGSGSSGTSSSIKTTGLAAVVSMFSMLPFASAQSGDDSIDNCIPALQVMVQAPAAYLGAVETCLAEVKDVTQCPGPFPEFRQCSGDTLPECAVAVVGAGAGGLYTALRMVDEGLVMAGDVCIFETTERVGGRLFSLRGLGPNQDLSVDAGGYRTWPQFTPTLHALITEYLEIPMNCYDESEEPCQKFNIVDAQGKKAGFATFVEEMMSRLVDGGACFYPYHELQSLARTSDTSDGSTTVRAAGEGTTELYFTNGVTAKATFTTILGIPQRPLLEVIRHSDWDTAGLLNADQLDALHSVQTVIATKLYLYYPKGSVFWQKLGLSTGDFEFDGDARNMLLQGRYHDGHVECDDPQDLNTCHGFLLAVYANDLSGNKAQYFRRFQRERAEPVTIISNSDLEGRLFLEHAHSRLENFHLYENTNANYTGFEAASVFSATSPPEFAVLSNWNTAVPWAGGAWHLWTELSNIPLAQQPFVKDNIFVVNEAYSLLQGWAEGSVKLADLVLQEHFGISRPWSFPVVDFNQVVAQTKSRECTVAAENGSAADTTGGGGSSGGGGDAGGDDVSSVLCFTGSSLVEMADGSYKRLDQVQVGDFVKTGTGVGPGLVTETLVHPVDKEVAVAVVPSKSNYSLMGEYLIGTPDHPVLINDDWVPAGSMGGVSLQKQYVKAFYNLEVDGDDIEGSSHSYVVNGVVASGLGDSKELNLRFARQAVWQQEQDHVEQQ